MNELTEQQAKELAAGHYGKQVSIFPLLFAKAAFFGQRPSPKRTTEIRNGTITLVEIGNRSYGITCHHVIEGYKQYREQHDDVIFNIGHVELDPVNQLVDSDPKIDIALIELTNDQIIQLTSEGEIGSQVHKPAKWPPGKPQKDEYVIFGGFPGSLRVVETFNEIVFYSWSSGGSRIDAGGDTRFITAFERDYWISSFGEKHNLELKDLGGMSGGPAFIKRDLHFEFVGILTDYEENYDTVFFASAQTINENGQIIKVPV